MPQTKLDTSQVQNLDATGSNTKDWKSRLEDYKCTGVYCHHETSDDHYLLFDDDIDSLLTLKEEEIRREERKKIKTDLAGLLFKGTIANELANGDGTGKQEPDYKWVVERIINSLTKESK